jgi:hypothetical protein
VALALAVVAVLAVISTTLGNDQDGGDVERGGTQTAEQRPRQNARQRRRQQRPFYTVRLNDTLGAISEKTGVPVERLQELNPELDPQNLIVGQRVRLRQ